MYPNLPTLDYVIMSVESLEKQGGIGGFRRWYLKALPTKHTGPVFSLDDRQALRFRDGEAPAALAVAKTAQPNAIVMAVLNRLTSPP